MYLVDEKLVNPLFISKGREQDPFNGLLNYDKNPKLFCPYWFDKWYNAEEKLKEGAPQRIIYPKDVIIHFKDIEKQLKLLFVIYADFECILTKIEEVDWNTTKNNVHEACRFTFTTVSDFFEARTVTLEGQMLERCS